MVRPRFLPTPRLLPGYHREPQLLDGEWLGTSGLDCHLPEALRSGTRRLPRERPTPGTCSGWLSPTRADLRPPGRAGEGEGNQEGLAGPRWRNGGGSDLGVFQGKTFGGRSLQHRQSQWPKGWGGQPLGAGRINSRPSLLLSASDTLSWTSTWLRLSGNLLTKAQLQGRFEKLVALPVNL